MDVELLFKIANYSVIPGWLLLVVAPRSTVTRLVVHSYLYPVVLGILYAILIVPAFFADGEGGMDSVANLQVSFENGYVLVGAWVHYLIFDLFIGAWESRDAVKRGIPHWQLVPCLILTLFAGPLGLLVYLIIRYFYRRKLTIA